MQWPEQWPDLYPIENLYKQFDDKVRLHGRFSNADELYQELQTAWSQLKQVQIIESMPLRCTEVSKKNDMPSIPYRICY